MPKVDQQYRPDTRAKTHARPGGMRNFEVTHAPRVCKDARSVPISTIVWTQLHEGEAMAERDVRATDPAAHQPIKAEMEEDVSIDATPEVLAWAVTRGGAERREPEKQGD